jgi:N-methylhydantoinase A
MDLHAGSSGILRIALSHMAEATKEIAAEHGDDPREFGLLCFGGGGPLFGSFLLDELEMAAAIIPVAPSTFSAWGMLMVDVRHDYMDALGARFDALVTEGMDIMAREGIPPQARRILKSLDIRYAGQEHTVSVPFDVATDGDSKAKLYDEFTRVYTEVYGYHLTPAPAEVVNARIAAVGEIPKARLKEIGQGTQQAQHALKGSRDVFDYVKGDWLRHDLYDRTKLLANNLVVGPALIEEPTTVTVVREGHRCEVDRLGNLVITRAARTSVPA